MPTKFPVKRAEDLLNPKLNETIDPQSIISLIPIRPYDVLGDIGSGPGYLSIPLAKYAYGGKLYAIDVQEGMLDIVKERAKASRLSNVETVLSKENTIPLDDGILDGVMMSGVLNEATKPAALLKEVHRLLRKGGWAAIIEWLPVEGKDGKPEYGPPAARRVKGEDLIEMAIEAGLRRVTHRSLDSHHYLVVLSK